MGKQRKEKQNDGNMVMLPSGEGMKTENPRDVSYNEIKSIDTSSAQTGYIIPKKEEKPCRQAEEGCLGYQDLMTRNLICLVESNYNRCSGNRRRM